MLKGLEIGPGDHPIKSSDKIEWKTLSALDGSDYKARWGYDKDPLPIDDNTFDIVYASHVIEHIPWYNVIDALSEVQRILKPRGRVEIWTIDFAKVVDAYCSGKCGDNWRRYNPNANPMMWVNGRVFAYERDGDLNWHKSLFDYAHMCSCMSKANLFGFRELNAAGKRGTKHGPAEFGVEGLKRP